MRLKAHLLALSYRVGSSIECEVSTLRDLVECNCVCLLLTLPTRCVYHRGSFSQRPWDAGNASEHFSGLPLLEASAVPHNAEYCTWEFFLVLCLCLWLIPLVFMENLSPS